MKPVVVVGSINLDMVVHAKRLPAAGETVMGSGFATHHGGKGANQAIAAARLGAVTAMIGCVGEDAFGTTLLQGLRSGGVDVSGIRVVEGASGVAVIQVDARKENRITVIAGANEALTPQLLVERESQIAEAGMVLTQLETPMATVEALATICRRHGVPLMLDPAPAALLSPKLLHAVRWLTPNLGEACTLLGREPADCSGEAEAVEMARALLALGPQGVLLKLGAAGLLALDRDRDPVFVPAFVVESVDTTAAGDATNAAFATALLRTESLEHAVRFAAGAGALTVTRHGAQPSLPNAREIRLFLGERSTGMA